MVSPFPGMDPYLEQPAFWPDFHVEFLANLRAQLNERLPSPYNAMIQESVRLVEPEPPREREVIPDVTIERGPGRTQRGRGGSAVATLEPVDLLNFETEERHDHWVEIRHRQGQDLVTVIELLSPSNKSNEWAVYRAKRRGILRQRVNLVELDLLLGGRRLPLVTPLPAGHYFTVVSRAEARPKAEAYPWTLRDPLPVVPVPLLPEDGDVGADLAAVFRDTYRRAAYGRLVDYGDSPPPLPLSPDELTWVTETARAGGSA